MTAKLNPEGEGGWRGATWRAFCRATELPGEHSLPDALRRARLASGRGDPESQWALRQYEALRQALEGEKRMLGQFLAAAILTLGGALALGGRGSARGVSRLLASLSALLVAALSLRILKVNLLLRSFWERPADD